MGHAPILAGELVLYLPDQALLSVEFPAPDQSQFILRGHLGRSRD